ncbi:DUF4262 domain-containing protein [Amycolatopsis sp. NPDC059657]|uniref:DUF4262 domain-containing protein n=1 Tax=Amycolatopsis sp. NPDC059657 TaxID=3346899 RepID=UPI0036718A8A
MCSHCDHPEAREDHERFLREQIRDNGWVVVGIDGDRLYPPWAYTVGLTELGRPELVVTGMDAPRSVVLLNSVAAHFAHAEPSRPGEQVRLRDGPLIEFVELEEPSAHLFKAWEFYGRELCALQIVHADERGRWPWDPAFRGGKGGQPVLGMRAG